MQHSDYSSITPPPYYPSYPQNPNPNPPSDHHYPNPTPTYSSNYASAPPYATTTNNYNYPDNNYAPTPFPSTNYNNYPPQIPDPISPTAPSSNSPPTILLNPNLQPPFPQFESHLPYQSQSQNYYPQFDQHQSAPNYAASANPNSTFNLSYQFENSVKLDHTGYGGSGSDQSSGYGRAVSDLGPGRYDSGGYGGGEAYGDGVYAYQGGKVEPYGARGTGSKSSTWSSSSASSSLFDDFGRPISFPKADQKVSSPKIVRAVPKVDTEQDAKGGVQKFRVKLLAESGDQSTMDVLCQIGLDGIRMLDPSTSRTLRIYPLDTVTRCDVTDSSTFAFWSKSTVDVEPRRIRLQSNRYTTNTILDTVTAATVQLKEMGGRSRPSEALKSSDQPAEKKKGLGDWMNLMKPVNEEKDHWVPDEAVTKCTSCGSDFSAFVRKHHCRNCGDIFCDKCTHGRIALTAEENAPQVRVCDPCMAEVTHRLSNAKETASRSAALESHEDLAKKLQEEMERNRKSSSESKSNGSGKRMKEVACPTCTVHLQVQVPSSGSETIECGVCQHPFLVSAH